MGGREHGAGGEPSFPSGAERAAGHEPEGSAAEAVAWAVAYLSEREVSGLEKAGTLNGVSLPGAEDSLTTAKAVAEERKMRAAYAKTALVVDEGSLASTVQARDLLRIASAIRIPRVVLVGDENQLESVTGERIASLEAVKPEGAKA